MLINNKIKKLQFILIINIYNIVREYDENFAPMSLDEAYMDITEYLELHGSNSWDVVQVVLLRRK